MLSRRTACLIALTLVAAAATAVARAADGPPVPAGQNWKIRISRHATAGGQISVRVKPDVTEVQSYRLCVTPPGGVRSCRTRKLDITPQTTVVPVPRPGRWTVSVRTDSGQFVTATVVVAPDGGRLHLLAAGDSEMQILDTDLANDLTGRPVTVADDARPSTGLENEWYFNWHGEAAHDAASDRPDVTVIFMGANGGFAIHHGSTLVPCCGPAWSRLYAVPVAQITQTLLRGAKGRVYWVLLPAPRPGDFTPIFDGVNRGIRDAAARFPGRVGLIDANAFFTPGNRYRDEMTVGGHTFTIHGSDGVHLSAASDGVLAGLIMHRLAADGIIAGR